MGEDSAFKSTYDYFVGSTERLARQQVRMNFESRMIQWGRPLKRLASGSSKPVVRGEGVPRNWQTILSQRLVNNGMCAKRFSFRSSL